MALSFQRSVVPYSHNTNKILTPVSLTQLQRQVLVLPASRLRFVLAPCKSEAELTPDGLAIKGTEQV